MASINEKIVHSSLCSVNLLVSQNKALLKIEETQGFTCLTSSHNNNNNNNNNEQTLID
jgi:hypothetical protein